MELVVFVLASAAAVVAAATVVLHRNPVICALALVINLLSVAVLFLALGAQFVAALQVIIYAGAIMVLIIFVIMLLGLPREARGLRSASVSATATAVLGAGAVLAGLLKGISAVPAASAEAPPGFGTAVWLSRSLFTTYFYPFEAISLVLVAAMAGAILLAKKEL